MRGNDPRKVLACDTSVEMRRLKRFRASRHETAMQAGGGDRRVRTVWKAENSSDRGVFGLLILRVMRQADTLARPWARCREIKNDKIFEKYGKSRFVGDLFGEIYGTIHCMV